MCSIVLIATGHRENGLCNSNELFRIIEEIAPEVIFEEIPSNQFAAVYEGKRSDTLETYTIKRYLQKHAIPHVPVDLNISDQIKTQIRHEVDVVFNIVAHYSPEYRNLFNEHVSNVEQFGFRYLNSDQCSSILDRSHFQEEQILKNLNYSNLSATYRNWLNFIASRENEMLKNIYDYSEVNRFDRALFLIGAEHRKPIMDNIPKFEKSQKQNINWIFNYL